MAKAKDGTDTTADETPEATIAAHGVAIAAEPGSVDYPVAGSDQVLVVKTN